MKELFLLAIFILGIYLYISIDQHSRDTVAKSITDIPAKVQYIIDKVGTING